MNDNDANAVTTAGGEPERNYMLIDGDCRAAADQATFDSINPFDGQPWAQVPTATTADIDAAVAAARRAFDGGPWSQSTPLQRATLLRKFGDLIRDNADELARIQVLENGKLIREVAGQTLALANHCYFFAGVAESPTGETLASSVPNMQVYTVREPIGVIAAITPWNSPLALLLWKLCPALAAGNTVVCGVVLRLWRDRHLRATGAVRSMMLGLQAHRGTSTEIRVVGITAVATILMVGLGLLARAGRGRKRSLIVGLGLAVLLVGSDARTGARTVDGVRVRPAPRPRSGGHRGRTAVA